QSAFISDLIGHCKESDVYVLKYYPYGALSHFEEFLPLDPDLNTKKRFKLCLNYIKIINFIHTSQSTPAVMCDTNTLNKTLEQYLLVETDTIVLNDVDSLTLIKSDGIVCGHQEITGDFVAPEQRWPYCGRTYDERLMPHYNEKTDIWKIPSVCQHILGNSNSALTIKFHLFKINKQCRSLDPSLRPTALKVLLSYDEVYTEFFVVKDEL
ncbi:UNVERIFIED_CONTAM: hypothetical protein GTU68_014726, partial [Idotea baltica]|nr:hypothetical protein [Idotea baltica]